MFIKRKKGFTVVEVMVAAAIFALFSGALFSIYRMGSRMFVSGSWKYTRQKEAERFFEILKERIEQASCLVYVSTGEPEVKQTNFVSKCDNTNISSPASSRIQLAEFAVCKPAYDEAIEKNNKGLILCHSISLVPDKTSKLFKLELNVAKDLNTPGLFGNLGSSCIESLGANTFSTSDAAATIEASKYSLGHIPSTYSLKDVDSISVTLLEGEVVGNKSDNEKPGIFGLTVEMKNPKHKRTILRMSFKAKIDNSVKIVSVE